MNGFIHSFESLGTVDGPGIRFIVFMQGCPLRCQYCHNPDTWNMKDAKHECTPEEVIQKVQNVKQYFGRKGGITISGGEPFLQAKFVKDTFKILKEQGIHTCVDTSGHYLNDSVKEALEYTDLILLDIKSIDKGVHKELTTKELDNTLEFMEYLQSINKPVWIRHVLVPGFTDNDDHLRILADYLKKFNNIQRIDVLPFHQLGEFKWEELRLEYKLKNTTPPTRDRVENAKQILATSGIEVK